MTGRQRRCYAPTGVPGLARIAQVLSRILSVADADAARQRRALRRGAGADSGWSHTCFPSRLLRSTSVPKANDEPRFHDGGYHQSRSAGATTVFLSAGSEAVARVYRRVGFVDVGTACVAGRPLP